MDRALDEIFDLSSAPGILLEDSSNFDHCARTQCMQHFVHASSLCRKQVRGGEVWWNVWTRTSKYRDVLDLNPVEEVLGYGLTVDQDNLLLLSGQRSNEWHDRRSGIETIIACLVSKLIAISEEVLPYLLGATNEDTCKYTMGRSMFWRVLDSVKELYSLVPFEARLRTRLPAGSQLWEFQGRFTRTVNVLRWACDIQERADINTTGLYGQDCRPTFFRDPPHEICHQYIQTDSYLETISCFNRVKIPANRERFIERYTTKDGPEFNDDRQPDMPEE
eukprot:2743506-Rhodomonas_salina.1